MDQNFAAVRAAPRVTCCDRDACSLRPGLMGGRRKHAGEQSAGERLAAWFVDQTAGPWTSGRVIRAQRAEEHVSCCRRSIIERAAHSCLPTRHAFERALVRARRQRGPGRARAIRRWAEGGRMTPAHLTGTCTKCCPVDPSWRRTASDTFRDMHVDATQERTAETTSRIGTGSRSHARSRSPDAPTPTAAVLRTSAEVAPARELLQRASKDDHLGRLLALSCRERVSRRPILQRSVLSFESEVNTGPSPAQNVKDVLLQNSTRLKDSSHTIAYNVEQKMKAPKRKTIEQPTTIRAVLESGRQTPADRGSRQQVVGHIGSDEFYIRRGVLSESFEGGHLIPHAVFDRDDDEAEMAGAFDNLVPMSRSLNVGDTGWADIEKQIASKLRTMDADDELEVTVSVEGEDTYRVTLGELAGRFDLTLKNPSVNQWREVELFAWIPKRLKPVAINLQTGSDLELDDVRENPLRRGHARISTGAGLLKRLDKMGVPISKSLREDLENL